MSVKKLVTLTLAMLMVLSLVACTGGPKTTPGTDPGTTPATTPTEPSSYHAKYGLPDVDYSGKTLEIVDGGTSWAEKASAEGDHNQIARFEMFSTFTEETGAEIVVIPSTYATQYTEAQPIIMTGDKYGDLLINSGWTIGQFYMSDILTPLNDLPHLDTSKDYWNDRLLETFTVQDKLWAVGGDIAPVTDITWMLFYNKTIAEELQLPNLYDMVRNGTWTFDKFIEYAEMAVQDDGDNMWTANDRYGAGCAPASMEQALFYGMGGEFYRKNEQGQYYCATMDDDNRERIDLIINKVRDNFISYDLNGGEDWTVNMSDLFPTDRLLFACYVPGATGSYWAEMTSDFGVLPMPKFNADQEDYYQTGEQAVISFFIGKNADQLDMTGYFLEFCGAYGKEVLVPAGEAFYETYFRDEDSLEMLHIACSGPRYERATLMLANTNGELFGPAQAAFNVTVQTPGASISSAYEASVEAANLKLADLFGY